ncbi:hypothetical protein NP493_5173g00007 [Ridgeia piscesae]|uniref:Protein kinase domain-containing protein n=1 Tax=Ridgeia piscesae TaxID=27915 RepID=A0AAD9IVE0_RIDPI|nr:hypothetical protein NP493_5173g00007 [Ridgeia piscesae]
MQRGSNAGTGHDVRVRREVGRYNSDDIQFYIGLILDGVPTYRNVSEPLPEFGQLDVFGNPELDRFEGDVLDFRGKDVHIVITVTIQKSCYYGRLVITKGDRYLSEGHRTAGTAPRAPHRGHRTAGTAPRATGARPRARQPRAHGHAPPGTAPHRTAPHRTAPHRTAPPAPHRTAPHRTAPHRTAPQTIRCGSRLDQGCSASDYSVTVGQGKCEVRELQTNQLTCQPPNTKPELGEFHKDGAPRVKVSVGYIKVVIGYLRYEETSTAVRTTVIIALCLLLFLMVTVLLCFFIYRKRKQSQTPHHLGHRGPYPEEDHEYIGLHGKPRDIVKALSPSLAATIERCKIDSTRMTLGKVIGKGNFGEVRDGQLVDKDNRKRPVAIKTIIDASTVRSVSEFLAEATIMHKFEHPNVLSLLGVVIEKNTPYVIMPLMKNGDLKGFIAQRDRVSTIKSKVLAKKGFFKYGH